MVIKKTYMQTTGIYTNIALTVMAASKVQTTVTYFGYLQDCKESNVVHGNDRILIFHHPL